MKEMAALILPVSPLSLANSGIGRSCRAVGAGGSATRITLGTLSITTRMYLFDF